MKGYDNKKPPKVKIVILYEITKKVTFPLQIYTYPNIEECPEKKDIIKSLNEMLSFPLNQYGMAELNSLFFYYATFKPHKSSLTKHCLIYVVDKQLSNSLATKLISQYVGVFKSTKMTLSGGKEEIEDKMKELLKDFKELNNDDDPSNDLEDIENETDNNIPFINDIYNDEKEEGTKQTKEKKNNFENYELLRQNENQLKKLLWWRKVKIIFIIICLLFAGIMYTSLPFLLKKIRNAEVENSSNLKYIN